ncbi:MAG TPA: hypothetical protein VEL47_03550 [Myxococcota bacterium]|nr:hypothetical protein [Myxococcota bacterium]
MKNAACFFALAFWLCASANGLPGPYDLLLEPFSKKSEKQKLAVIFHGLQFLTEPATTTCKPKASQSELNCTIAIKGPSGAQGEIRFEKKVVKSPSSLPLIKMQRKENFLRQYSLKNRPLETDYQAGAFKTRLEQYRYFRLDNIFWPVLLRAFDIALDDKTIISVTTTCTANDWPLIQHEIEGIELSFKKGP